MIPSAESIDKIHRSVEYLQCPNCDRPAAWNIFGETLYQRMLCNFCRATYPHHKESNREPV